ncbi:MAG: DUF4177 domain-containing protein [Prevotellaceae bacterium]|jgi:hypothetical protein|nr:DUF4177 domain-containing protein [Prevotellaceae bacterium]
MFEYKFVRVQLKSGFARNKPKENHHDIIKMHARQGWRLVQIFAPSIGIYGAANFYELIFEKPISHN